MGLREEYTLLTNNEPLIKGTTQYSNNYMLWFMRTVEGRIDELENEVVEIKNKLNYIPMGDTSDY